MTETPKPPRSTVDAAMSELAQFRDDLQRQIDTRPAGDPSRAELQTVLYGVMAVERRMWVCLSTAAVAVGRAPIPVLGERRIPGEGTWRRIRRHVGNRGPA